MARDQYSAGERAVCLTAPAAAASVLPLLTSWPYSYQRMGVF